MPVDAFSIDTDCPDPPPYPDAYSLSESISTDISIGSISPFDVVLHDVLRLPMEQRRTRWSNWRVDPAAPSAAAVIRNVRELTNRDVNSTRRNAPARSPSSWGDPSPVGHRSPSWGGQSSSIHSPIPVLARPKNQGPMRTNRRRQTFDGSPTSHLTRKPPERKPPPTVAEPPTTRARWGHPPPFRRRSEDSLSLSELVSINLDGAWIPRDERKSKAMLSTAAASYQPRRFSDSVDSRTRDDSQNWDQDDDESVVVDAPSSEDVSLTHDRAKPIAPVSPDSEYDRAHSLQLSSLQLSGSDALQVETPQHDGDQNLLTMAWYVTYIDRFVAAFLIGQVLVVGLFLVVAIAARAILLYVSAGVHTLIAVVVYREFKDVQTSLQGLNDYCVSLVDNQATRQVAADVGTVVRNGIRTTIARLRVIVVVDCMALGLFSLIVCIGSAVTSGQTTSLITGIITLCISIIIAGASIRQSKYLVETMEHKMAQNASNIV